MTMAIVLYRSDVVTMAVCSLQVGGLVAGESYVFRVIALNAEGAGKASQVSEPILAQALPGNPYFLSSLPPFLPPLLSRPHLSPFIASISSLF